MGRRKSKLYISGLMPRLPVVRSDREPERPHKSGGARIGKMSGRRCYVHVVKGRRLTISLLKSRILQPRNIKKVTKFPTARGILVFSFLLFGTCLTTDFLTATIHYDAPENFNRLSAAEALFEKASTSQVRVPDEKITKVYRTITQKEVDDALGPPFVAIEFACHSTAEKGLCVFLYRSQSPSTAAVPGTYGTNSVQGPCGVAMS